MKCFFLMSQMSQIRFNFRIPDSLSSIVKKHQNVPNGIFKELSLFFITEEREVILKHHPIRRIYAVTITSVTNNS